MQIKLRFLFTVIAKLCKNTNKQQGTYATKVSKQLQNSKQTQEDKTLSTMKP